MSAIFLFALLSACRTDDPKIDTGGGGDDCTWYADADGDGYGVVDAPATGPCDEDISGYVDNDLDCDDGDASINPDADEYCNGIDDDCDGQTDEDAVDADTFFLDADGDGHGGTGGTVTACEAPDGYVDESTDCDDDDPETYPGAAERCDGLDNDCDGEIDEDLQELWYADTDADGYGNADSTLDSCDPGEGWVADTTDCDDGNSAVNPGAEEVCNDIDDDCDGEVDEELATTWYQDADGDGFGDAAVETLDCDPGAGWVDNAEDCDDANSGIHPDAQEECNGYDDDCDGLVDDEDDSIVGTSTWYQDADGDGYGDDASTADACEMPSGYAEYGGDCDDGDAAYNPGASEDDCTDPADYNCDGSTGYTDDDGDGYAACEDCDDADAGVNPDADEVCDNVDNDCDGTIDADAATDADTWYADADGDGYGDLASTTTACDPPSGYVSLTYATDCDDGDASVSPVAAESCNGVDDDCDGDVDEGVMDTFYLDADADGYGDAASTSEACDLPSGYSADDTDCDDGDAAVNPGADEICDGMDNDCDGTTDEPDATDASTWYRDNDGDGYGDAAAVTVSCDQPTGYVSDGTDCDDYDDDVHPGADEHCDGADEDCDGDIDEDAVDGDSWYADADADGYGDASDGLAGCSAPTGYVADLTDCDDGDAAINPAATEICDGIDNDCDGWVDDDDPAVTGTSTWYVDYDGDGYGGSSLSVDACEQPSSYVADSTDCDDADATAYPGATEVCDGADNDCDGDTDEDYDADADGLADCFDSEECDGVDNDGDGLVDEGFDADADGLADCFDAEECDGVDNDGDGLVDDDDPDVTGTTSWYVDYDGDGYGGSRLSVDACEQPSSYVADNTDCDDSDASAYPGADEVCDGADNDCDGDTDEDDATDVSTWYADADGDGYGDASSSSEACSEPSGYVSDDTDCDDGDGAVNPGATEVCDGVDNDCDGLLDDGDPSVTGTTTYSADVDGDGYGDASSTTTACTQPSGYVTDDSDCDDSAAAVNPAASEICDGVDNDCDGLVDDDDGSVTGASTWYSDDDADGYGDASSSDTACSAPSGYVSDATDCDDGDAGVYPGADEYCDGADNDCDGTTDEGDAVDADSWYSDADGDGYGDVSVTQTACDQPSGYVSDTSDCDDGDAAVNPAGSETCNGYDDDCDGLVDDDDSSVTGTSTWYQDYDLDGYGDISVTTSACDEPSGYVSDATDCDDGDYDINPGASEVCNGLDDDCDGTADSTSACPCYVETYDNHPYMFCTSTTTWSSAQSTCWSYDYHMLTIDDSSENSWADATADTYSTSKWWMGFNDISSEGSWVWEDGSAVSYTNWHSGEPNDSGGEDCGQINRFHPDVTWNDEPCSSSFYYICEAD